MGLLAVDEDQQVLTCLKVAGRIAWSSNNIRAPLHPTTWWIRNLSSRTQLANPQRSNSELVNTSQESVCPVQIDVLVPLLHVIFRWRSFFFSRKCLGLHCLCASVCPRSFSIEDPCLCVGVHEPDQPTSLRPFRTPQKQVKKESCSETPGREARGARRAGGTQRCGPDVNG